MKEPVVSVIIPAYNAARFITETLQCVVTQTLSKWEVIVVDDGSSDGTAQIVSAFMSRHAMPGRCLTQENKGIASARNTGIASARGEYIAFLDHDDMWHPAKLERTLLIFAEFPDVGLVCHDEHVTLNGMVLATKTYGISHARPFEDLLFRGNGLSTSAVVVKKSVIEKVGLFNEDQAINLAEDYDLWIRASRATKFYFLHEILGEYRTGVNYATKRVEAHHQALLTVINRHYHSFCGQAPSVWNSLRIRKRRAGIYRAACRSLIKSSDLNQRGGWYLQQAFKRYPLDLKTWLVALEWLFFSLVYFVTDTLNRIFHGVKNV